MVALAMFSKVLIVSLSEYVTRSFFVFFINFFLFAEQRLDRVFKKIKNERATVITKKSRVNKKIRRIFNNKKRVNKKIRNVNAKFLKYTSVFFLFFFFLTDFFKLRVRLNRLNVIYDRFKARESFFIFKKDVTLKLLNVLKAESFTSIEKVTKIKVSFEFLFLRASLFSSEILNEGFLKLKSFSS